MKRMALVWFVQSLLGPSRKRPDWTLLMVVAGIAMALMMIGLRWAH
jgi:hypothetical protein